MNIRISKWYADDLDSAIGEALDSGGEGFKHMYNLGEEESGSQVFAFSKEALPREVVNELEQIVSEEDLIIGNFIEINEVEYKFIE